MRYLPIYCPLISIPEIETLTWFIYRPIGFRHLLSATIDSAASSFLSARTICSIHCPSDNSKVKYNKFSIIIKKSLLNSSGSLS